MAWSLNEKVNPTGTDELVPVSRNYEIYVCQYG